MSKLVLEISDAFGLSKHETMNIIRSAPHRYKSFKIRKRSSKKTRTVAQPAREVKKLQRWLVTGILQSLPVHDAATAYVSGRGIRLNAQRHVNSRYLLKMDFEEYFPSIKLQDVKAHLTKHINKQYEEGDILLMCHLVLWRPKRTADLELCIGGPSSPLISNSIAFEFDEIVSTHCSNRGVVYSRYADDLTFSTGDPETLREIETFAESACQSIQYPSLRINHDKTVHVSKKYKRLVTGVTLSAQGKCSLGRERKRLIRAGLHRAKKNQLSDSDMSQLRGYLAFANDVEPEFFHSMKRKYGEGLIRTVLRWQID